MNQSPIGHHIQAVMRLLLDSGVAAAHAYLDRNILPEVAAQEARLVALKREETAIRNIIALSQAGQAVEPAQTQAALQPVVIGTSYSTAVVAEDARRQAVLDLATEIAGHSTDATVAIETVVAEAAKRGIELSSRPGTSIANILFRSPAWQRLSTGLFRLTA